MMGEKARPEVAGRNCAPRESSDAAILSWPHREAVSRGLPNIEVELFGSAPRPINAITILPLPEAIAAIRAACMLSVGESEVGAGAARPLLLPVLRFRR